ncbi:hypothetical protein MCOR25_008913 [Pyricularia grisea]|nr:hypothetical protein MCOR25_008913 [Pyricularia grisea]
MRAVFVQQYYANSTQLCVRLKSSMTQELYHTAMEGLEIDDCVVTALLESAGSKSKAKKKSKGAKATAAGKLVNLMSSDIDEVYKARDFIITAFNFPLGLMLATWMLWDLLGWRAIPGLIVVIAGLRLAKLAATRIAKAKKAVKKAQDRRVSLLHEYTTSIQYLKQLAWEDLAAASIGKVRAEELTHLWTYNLWYAISSQIIEAIPVSMVLAMLVPFAWANHPLSASLAFTTASLCGSLRAGLTTVNATVRKYESALISLNRLDKYFKSVRPLANYPTGSLSIRNASFYRRRSDTRVALKNINLDVHDLIEGQLNVLTGKSGSGKTMLLRSILGETLMDGRDASMTRPRNIVYASQTPWLINQSIKLNIILGKEFNEQRYNRVIRACSLACDLGLLPHGDESAVGPNGSSLSGGQRSRIALARTLYAADTASLVLLDDVFAALDTRTTAKVWQECFCGEGSLLHNKTVLLVTQLASIKGQAAAVIKMRNGEVVRTYHPAQTPPRHDLGAVATPNDSISITVETQKPPGVSKQNARPTGLLALSKYQTSEDVNKGAAKGQRDQALVIAIWHYLQKFGGSWYWVVCGLVTTGASLAPLLPPWALSKWAQSSDRDHGEYFSGPKGLLIMFFGLSLIEAALTMGMHILFARGAWQAANRLNNEAVLAIMDASPKWYSQEIPGSIVTCLTKDLDSLDTDLGRSLLNVIRLVLQTISRIVVTASIITDFIWPALICCVLATVAGRAYSKTTKPVKNLVQAARSPVFTLYSETLGGLAILRAARDPGPTSMRVVFGKMLAHKLLVYSRAMATQLNLGRWLAIHVEALAMLLSVTAGAIALLRKDSLLSNGTPAASLALSIHHAVALGDVSLKLIKAWSDLDMEINALTRILHLAEAEPEDINDSEHIRYNMEDEVWPQSGSIRFTNVTAKYDQSDKIVLKDVTLDIKPGERVAIVGRTGAGKSSIIQTLLRRTQIVSGSVEIDGVDIRAVSRKRLRRSVAYIPQDAVLYNGSIRDNLTLGESIEDKLLYKTLKDCAKAAGWNVEALSDTDTPSQDDTTATTVHRASAEETSEHSPLLPRHHAVPSPSPVTGRSWRAYSKAANAVARLYNWTCNLRTERPPRDINFAGLQIPRLGSEIDTQNESHDAIRAEETGSSSAYLNDMMLINQRGTAVRLSTQVGAGGQNFSHGERQVVSLARALVRGRANNGRAGKVFLMDEATSSMDPKMDKAIQEVIRREVGLPSGDGCGGGGDSSSNSDMDDAGSLSTQHGPAHPRPSRQTTYEQDAAPKGRTLITIAHRLQTIRDYDKIVVMDNRRIVQVGCWDTLVRDSDSLFAKMVEATGEDILLATETDGQPGPSVAKRSNSGGL